jgi:hypothetical protein
MYSIVASAGFSFLLLCTHRHWKMSVAATNAYYTVTDAFDAVHLNTPLRRAAAGTLLVGGLLFLTRPAYFFPDKATPTTPPVVSAETAAMTAGLVLALL